MGEEAHANWSEAKDWTKRIVKRPGLKVTIRLPARSKLTSGSAIGSWPFVRHELEIHNMTRTEVEQIALRHVAKDRPLLTQVKNATLFTEEKLAGIPAHIKARQPAPPYWSVALGLEDPPDVVTCLPSVFIFVSDTTGEILEKSE